MYEASCAGVELTRHGYRPVKGLVAPGERVFVRCTDTTRYGGEVAWIDPKSVIVRSEPCEHSGGGPDVGVAFREPA